MGAVAAAALPWAEPAGDPLEQPGLLSYWAHWDGAWYTEIAAAGYIARAPESTAFFPVFPMIMRVGSVLGGGPALWGILVSLVATAFALYFCTGSPRSSGVRTSRGPRRSPSPSYPTPSTSTPRS